MKKNYLLRMLVINLFLVITLGTQAQSFLFESNYHYNGVVKNLIYGSRNYLEPFDCYIKVYTDRLILNAKGSTEVWSLYRVLNNGSREYKKDGLKFYVNPNNHYISFYPNDYYYSDLKDYNPPKSASRNNQNSQGGTIYVPVTPSTPQTPSQAPICNKCNGAGYYYINGSMHTCTQCGGGGRDWNSY